jgi:mersacidin/lichenicidin family type 2 lantibiotic
MSNINIIRAWKDEEYRSTLSQADLDFLPSNPAGPDELSDEELQSVDGGAWTHIICCFFTIWAGCSSSEG